MRHTGLLASTATVVLALLPFAALSAQAAFLSEGEKRQAAEEALVWVSNDVVEAVFPTLASRHPGCAPSQVPGEDLSRRRYAWYVIARFPGASLASDHFVRIFVQAYLPEDTPAAAVLVRAIERAEVEVAEYRGEPPSPREALRPLRTDVRVEQGRVRVRVESAAVVQALLRPGGDRVTVGWCSLDVQFANVDVPVRRRQQF